MNITFLSCEFLVLNEPSVLGLGQQATIQLGSRIVAQFFTGDMRPIGLCIDRDQPVGGPRE